ncbi:tyrosine-type recombinase/integrase [Paenibacillus sp. GCM10027627]|uniref:tyrosine-type recombinase/integrase n=1 Tax=unclassified Paenibacillus TaxID=185978 RepID=UPI003625143C
MARRNNRLTPAELSPGHKPLYVVDDFESAMHLFLRDCKIRNISAHTITFYRTELIKFMRLLESQDIPTAPEKITSEIIKENIILRMMELGRKETTINCTLRAVRTLFNFLVKESYILRSPMRDMTLVKQKRTIIQTFSRDQMRALLRQPDPYTFVGVRDATFLMLLIETGVRVRELVDIKLSDIMWQDGVIKIDGKGYKQRHVPIQITMKKQLQKYVKLRGELDHEALFVNVDNKPLKIRTVQEQMQAYGRAAGITGVRCSPHTARHTFAKMSVQNGADVFALQSVLGHASLEMVRTYVNLFSHEVTAQHRKFSPLEGLQ